MCPSEFSALWGSELRSYHALPSRYSEEKKRKAKVGHTDGISSSPPCQPYVPPWGCLFVFFHLVWEGPTAHAQCSAHRQSVCACCLQPSIRSQPLTSDPYHPLPLCLRLGSPPCVPLDVMGPCFYVSHHAFLNPPVCVMSTLECVCVCTQTVCVVQCECVCHVTWFPLAHCTASFWPKQVFFSFTFFLFIKMITEDCNMSSRVFDWSHIRSFMITQCAPFQATAQSHVMTSLQSEMYGIAKCVSFSSALPSIAPSLYFSLRYFVIALFLSLLSQLAIILILQYNYTRISI